MVNIKNEEIVEDDLNNSKKNYELILRSDK
jgi:hypothetical protein